MARNDIAAENPMGGQLITRLKFFHEATGLLAWYIGITALLALFLFAYWTYRASELYWHLKLRKIEKIPRSCQPLKNR